MNQFGSLTKLITIVNGRLGRPPGEPRTNYRPAERPRMNYNAFREAYSCSFVYLKSLSSAY